MMNLRSGIAADQIRYRKPIDAVRRKLKDMGIKPLTEIRIYPIYPEGYEAVVGAKDAVYVFKSSWGPPQLSSVEPLQGFLPNGGLIRLIPDWKGRLLRALVMEDDDAIIEYAIEAFITDEEGDWNVERVKEFEKFANCRILKGHTDGDGWMPTEIHYGKKVFFWGWMYADHP